MNRHLRRFVWLALLSWPAALLAQSKPDLSSPKRAEMAFAMSLRNGDIAGIRASTMGAEEDYKLMETIAGTMSAAGKLLHAAVARFGAEQGKKIAASMTTGVDIPREIEESDQKVEGDTASIVEKGAPDANALKLRKVNGDWKVDLAQYPQKKELVQTIPGLDAARKVLAQGAKDISSGKYATADEANQNIQQQLLQVMAASAKH